RYSQLLEGWKSESFRFDFYGIGKSGRENTSHLIDDNTPAEPDPPGSTLTCLFRCFGLLPALSPSANGEKAADTQAGQTGEAAGFGDGTGIDRLSEYSLAVAADAAVAVAVVAAHTDAHEIVTIAHVRRRGAAACQRRSAHEAADKARTAAACGKEA